MVVVVLLDGRQREYAMVRLEMAMDDVGMVSIVDPRNVDVLRR